MSPEPMTRGSSSGTSEMNSGRAGRPRSRAASRPPLMRDSAARRRFNSPMASPSAKARRVSASRSGSVTPASGTSTRLEAPPEMRNSGSTSPGRLSTHASSRPPAASERSSGTGWAPMRTSAPRRAISGERGASRVMRSARSMAPPSASYAPSAMDSAALPTPASHTGAAGCWGLASASRTQRRPSTRRRPVSRRASSSARRGSPPSGSSAAADDFELAVPFAARVLRRIRALQLQPPEIFGRDVSGHVFAREAGGVELLDARILVLAGCDQVGEVLVHQPVRADEARHLLHRAAAVTVLDEALAVLDGEALRELQRAGAAGVRDRDDHVDVVPGALAQDLVRQAIAHAHAGAVDGDVVDLRVGAREVHVFEDAGGVARRDRKSTRLNSSHITISYAVFCLKKKKE